MNHCFPPSKIEQNGSILFSKDILDLYFYGSHINQDPTNQGEDAYLLKSKKLS